MTNEYITTDIYLASTLSALDFTLEEITQEGNKFYFHFYYNEEIQTSPHIISINADQYWTGNLLIDPKKLFTEFKEIKTRMYDFKRRILK